MSSRKISRRQMLGGMAGVGTLAFHSTALSLILKALIEKRAMAEGVTGGTNKNLIYILHYGAPPRWGFDAFLNPNNSSSEIIENASVRNFLGTLDEEGQYQLFYEHLNNSLATYRQTKTPINYLHQGVSKEIFLPKLWDALIPEFSGTSATLGNLKMRDLLKNVCMIRGVHMLADNGHIEGPAYLPRPHPMRPSLSGLVADQSTRKLAAVAVGGGLSQPIGFSAVNSGIFRASAASANPLMDLLGPLQPESASWMTPHAENRNLLKASFDSVLSQLEVDAKKKFPGAEKFYASLRNSKSLYEDTSGLLQDLGTKYTALLGKYQKIGMACRTHLGAGGLLPEFVAESETAPLSSVYRYASGLAVTEFLIKNGLSSTVTLSGGGSFNVGRVKNRNGDPETVRGAPGDYVQFDEHRMSCRQGHAIVHNLMFRVLMASLHEFKRSIGEEEFRNTLVVIGAEYGRCGRADGKGSDHAVAASAVTLYSGMLNDFQPIGNIKKQVPNPSTSEHSGTWGLNALTKLLSDGSQISITRSEISRTVADLMGVGSPVSGKSLLVQEGGFWRSNAEVPRNVD